MTNELAWVDVEACTLPTAEQPLRVAEFHDLFTRHLTDAELHAPTKATLWFAPEPGLAESVADLAGREASCCSFFTFSIDETGDALALGVEVPAAHAGVLRALVAQAETAAKARTA